MNKDEIRQKLFSSTAFETREVPINGTKLEIRQPSLGKLFELQELLESNRKRGIAMMLINFCFVPGTNERVFDEADEESILAMPFNSDMQNLNKTMNELTGVKVEQEVKNLEEVHGDITPS